MTKTKYTIEELKEKLNTLTQYDGDDKENICMWGHYVRVEDIEELFNIKLK